MFYVMRNEMKNAKTMTKTSKTFFIDAKRGRVRILSSGKTVASFLKKDISEKLSGKLFELMRSGADFGISSSVDFADEYGFGDFDLSGAVDTAFTDARRLMRDIFGD